jgi:hypothetical protein
VCLKLPPEDLFAEVTFKAKEVFSFSSVTVSVTGSTFSLTP